MHKLQTDLIAPRTVQLTEQTPVVANHTVEKVSHVPPPLLESEICVRVTPCGRRHISRREKPHPRLHLHTQASCVLRPSRPKTHKMSDSSLRLHRSRRSKSAGVQARRRQRLTAADQRARTTQTRCCSFCGGEAVPARAAAPG